MPGKGERGITDKGRDVDKQELKMEDHNFPSMQNNGSTNTSPNDRFLVPFIQEYNLLYLT